MLWSSKVKQNSLPPWTTYSRGKQNEDSKNTTRTFHEPFYVHNISGHLRRWYCSWAFCFRCNWFWCLSLMLSASKTVKTIQVKKWEAGLILDHLDWILLKYVGTLAFSCLCLCWRRDWSALWHFLCYFRTRSTVHCQLCSEAYRTTHKCVKRYCYIIKESL